MIRAPAARSFLVGVELSNDEPGQESVVTNAANVPEHSGKALQAGVRIAEFEVIRVLGEGGFGIVYLAFDQHLHRHVAIKEYFPASYAVRDEGSIIMPLSIADQDTFVAGMQAFLEEARFLARFEHPALLKVLRFWEDNGTAYMAMPHYTGRTLKEILRISSAFGTEQELRALIAPLLDAVELLHTARIFHRDISPENVIIRPNGSPVLLDFGAARRILSDRTAALTVIVNPSYAPIEQYSDDGAMPQGPWTDVYGLAALLYTAITRSPPPSAVARVYRDPMKPLAKVAPEGFGVHFLTGVDRGMAVRPDDRPRTIGEFRVALGLAESDAGLPAVAPIALASPTPAGGLPTATTVPEPTPSTFSRSPVASEPPVPQRGALAGAEPARNEPAAEVFDARIIVTPESRYVPPPIGGPSRRNKVLARAGVAVVIAAAIGVTLTVGRNDEGVKIKSPILPAESVATSTPTLPPAPPAAPRPDVVEPVPAPPSSPIATPPVDAAPVPQVSESTPMAAKTPALSAKSTPAFVPPKPASTDPHSPQPKAAKSKDVPSDAKSAVAPPVASAKPAANVPGPESTLVAKPSEPTESRDGPRELSEDGRRVWSLAERGDATAQLSLGRMYASGIGTAKNAPEAAKWFRLAADQGNAQAQNNLGAMYAAGNGVVKDDAEALKWYRRAADQGFASAQLNLGVMYASGQGVVKDENEATAWYRKAAEQGNARAQYNLGVMYTNGHGVAKDEAEAARWFRRAAEGGIAAAQHTLAGVYAAGRGVMRDESEAVVWYRKAAAQGYVPAIERLKQIDAK